MTPILPDPLKDQMPICRIGEPDEISAFVVFLSSKRTGFITGETIDINGGIWMDYLNASHMIKLQEEKKNE